MEKSIRDLIARLPIPGLKESTNRHCIAEILSNTLSIPIKANQITLKDEILTVKVPPVVKSAIQIKQGSIKEKLSKENIEVKTIR
jgi:hypothetical protein